MAAHLTFFISEEQYLHTLQKSSRTASFAQVTSLSKLYGKLDPAVKPISKVQSNDFQKINDLIKRSDEKFEPCRADNFESCDIDIWTKFLHGDHSL